eukprot:TRINITY_DN7358_c0_g1_i1.p1 TRINITY_DN7358_c0_g1~~TRINITY_DN7358_c0_g1_i1.p1  ORF type:complete len:502 (+),score=71.57 TRINITY_DN7358_c0_g1_i1:28-1533(+)
MAHHRDDGDGHHHGDEEDLTLHRAAYRGAQSRIKQLLALGANINAVDEDGASVIHWAAGADSAETLNFLLEQGAEIRVNNTLQGESPLHWCAKVGSVEAARWLLRHGAHADAKDSLGATPLMIACANGEQKFVEMLISEFSVDVNTLDNQLRNALHWCTSKDQVDLAALLVQAHIDWRHTDEEGYNALHNAAETGSSALVQMLLFQGLDVNALTKRNETARMIAVRNNRREVADILALHEKGLSFKPRKPVHFWYLNWALNIGLQIMFHWQTGPLMHSWFLRLLAFVLGVVNAWALYKTSSTDPGFLPTNQFDSESGIPWKNQLCFTCRTARPLRSKHCRYCGRCVARFDHHCNFTLNCVGVNNHRIFLFYVFVQTLIGVTGIASYLSLVAQFEGSPSISSPVLWIYFMASVHPIGVPMFGFMVVFMYLMANFFGMQCASIIINVTTNEMQNGFKYSYFHTKDVPTNPFDKGAQGNVYEFMGWLRTRLDYYRLFEVPRSLQ